MNDNNPKTYVEDVNGNRANFSYWGSEAKALASLATLINCRDCVDCSRCSGCKGCTDCSHCSDCKGCTDCSHCSDCSDCSRCSDCSDCSRCSDCSDCPSQPVTAQRSDFYTFAAFKNEAGEMRVHAGCRRFSMPEARDHWTRARGGTKLGDETMLILDYLEKAIALRSEPVERSDGK